MNDAMKTDGSSHETKPKIKIKLRLEMLFFGSIKTVKYFPLCTFVMPHFISKKNPML